MNIFVCSSYSRALLLQLTISADLIRSEAFIRGNSLYVMSIRVHLAGSKCAMTSVIFLADLENRWRVVSSALAQIYYEVCVLQGSICPSQSSLYVP